MNVNFAAALNAPQPEATDPTEKLTGYRVPEAIIPAPVPEKANGQSNPLDLAQPKAVMSAFSESLAEMKRAAAALKVDSDESEKEAVELGTRANKLAKEVDKRRMEITQEARDFTASVNNLAKQFTEPAKAVTAELKGKIGAYRQAKELERRKREAAERKAREEAQRKIDEEARAANVEPVKLPEPVAAKPANVTRAESGSAHGQKRWTFEVEDETKVPRQYLTLDSPRINAAIKAGIREIPGLKIFQKESVVFK